MLRATQSIIKEEGLSDKLYKPAFVYNRISLAKNNLIDLLPTQTSRIDSDDEQWKTQNS